MREISLYRSDCDLLARLQNLEERRQGDSQVSWKKESIKCLSLSGWEMYHEQMCNQCSCQSGVHHLVGLVNHLGQHLGATCFEWSLDPSHSYYTGSHTLHTTIGHQFNTVCDSSHSYIWCIYTSIYIDLQDLSNTRHHRIRQQEKTCDSEEECQQVSASFTRTSRSQFR